MFTPGSGREDVGDYVAGDESTLDHRQIGGHIASVQRFTSFETFRV